MPSTHDARLRPLGLLLGAWLLTACPTTLPGADAGTDAGARDAGTDSGTVDGDAGCNGAPPLSTFSDATPELAVSLPSSGPPNNGITDPYLTGFEDGGSTLLVFSVTDTALLTLPDAGTFTEVGLIRTQAAVPVAGPGGGFTFVSNANLYQSLEIRADGGVSACDGGGGCSAFLVHEVPTVVTDPTDPDPNRHFKLFVHSYVQAVSPNREAQLHVYLWGFIGMQTAASAATAWSGEKKLLGWTSSLPALSSEGATQNLNLLAPELADCIAFSEPGAVAYDGVIDLALGCVSAEKVNGENRQRIVLVRSTDHAASFQYVGVLLTSDDALLFGDTRAAFTGAALFLDHGSEYLSATTEGPLPGAGSGSSHQACFTFPFVSGSHDALQRDACGTPHAIREIRSANGRQSGTCTYFRPAGGYLVDTAAIESPPRIFRVLSPSLTDP